MYRGSVVVLEGKTKTFIIMAVFLIVLTGFYISFINKPYGTDKESIIKVRMELGGNHQVIEQEFTMNQHGVYWIDLPESKDGNYDFIYQYFDQDGNVIEDTF
jgi:hypothetical protein